MKKLVLLFALLFTAICLFGCGTEKPVGFEVKDITLMTGEVATIDEAVTCADYHALTVTVGNSNVVTYNNGLIEAHSGGKTKIKVVFNGEEKTFTVTVAQPLTVDDTNVFIGYPDVEIIPYFYDGIVKEDITYEYSGDIIDIHGNYITALNPGTAEVTVKTTNYTTSFKVTSYEVEKLNPFYKLSDPNWSVMAHNLREQWLAKGTNGRTTIFIGDSFFDYYFFSTFYRFYGDYDALCLGIGGTTSFTWEILADTMLEGVYPKNVVVNLGNNNVYNIHTEDMTIVDLERYFILLHGKMPDTQIYAFAITPRTFVSAWNEPLTIKETNAALARWCESRDWITFLDTDEMTYDKLVDGIHPAPDNYNIFVEKLFNAGIQIEKK